MPTYQCQVAANRSSIVLPARTMQQHREETVPASSGRPAQVIETGEHTDTDNVRNFHIPEQLRPRGHGCMPFRSFGMAIAIHTPTNSPHVPGRWPKFMASTSLTN